MTTGLNGYRHVSYKGHAITVERTKTLGGDTGLSYAIFRESDQYECYSGFQYDGNSLRLLAHLQAMVDQELEKEDPWDEHG